MLEILQKQVETLQKKLEAQESLHHLISRTIKDIFAEDKQELIIPPEPVARPKKKHYQIPVLHISDVQWGKTTESYNPIVAQQRLLRLVDLVEAIVESQRTHAIIDRLHLYLGGDIVEGHDIFPGQGQQIQYGAYRQAKYVSDALASMILGFLRFVKKIKISCVPGNHGRIGKDDPDSNWDTQVYDLVKLKLSSIPSTRLEFPDPGPWYQIDNVLGWGNLIVHGHQIQGNGFPLNGAIRKAMGWIDSIPESWDYLFFGHFHTWGACVANNRILLPNGSPESGNTYAQETMAAVGSPVQRLCFFDKKHGMIADYPLYLDGRKPNKK